MVDPKRRAKHFDGIEFGDNIDAVNDGHIELAGAHNSRCDHYRDEAAEYLSGHLGSSLREPKHLGTFEADRKRNVPCDPYSDRRRCIQ